MVTKYEGLSLDEIAATYGDKEAKAEADRQGRLWYSSAGAVRRRPREAGR